MKHVTYLINDASRITRKPVFGFTDMNEGIGHIFSVWKGTVSISFLESLRVHKKFVQTVKTGQTAQFCSLIETFAGFPCYI